MHSSHHGRFIQVVCCHGMIDTFMVDAFKWHVFLAWYIRQILTCYRVCILGSCLVLCQCDWVAHDMCWVTVRDSCMLAPWDHASVHWSSNPDNTACRNGNRLVVFGNMLHHWLCHPNPRSINLWTVMHLHQTNMIHRKSTNKLIKITSRNNLFWSVDLPKIFMKQHRYQLLRELKASKHLHQLEVRTGINTICAGTFDVSWRKTLSCLKNIGQKFQYQIHKLVSKTFILVW